MINFIFNLVLLAPMISVGQIDSVQIIPQPNSINYKSGTYWIDKTFTLNSNSGQLNPFLKYTTEILQEDFRTTVHTSQEKKNNPTLQLVLDAKEETTNGAYLLVVFAFVIIRNKKSASIRPTPAHRLATRYKASTGCFAVAPSYFHLGGTKDNKSC